ncbi:MAG: hypothetical protein JSV51_05280 [Candidatus Bathyarchaeota archaeon]|nr:MAG: hypothetical protein JSV51_05280 [Candidatus Bathyarchaeota archaeon]
MPRSRLEKYLSVLEVLVPRPSRLDSISYKTNIECTTLRKYLTFLISNNLVEEHHSEKRKTVYAITERGSAVFKTLQVQKYFEKLKKTLPEVKEAGEKHSLVSKQAQIRESQSSSAKEY